AEDPDLGQAAKIAASAMLRGARGNSGVILSLLLRGISKKLKDLQTTDGVLWAQALQEGVDAAYKAVMKPAEGTILTVARLA
ncbi:DAK2 domain-containing protein, partial [Acinetobacter baumannii]|uniref:DAK2 domain-containing protein n=1 Tax=Acinetobacter baumannii TaxID=470 RepID=UPI0031F4688A